MAGLAGLLGVCVVGLGVCRHQTPADDTASDRPDPQVSSSNVRELGPIGSVNRIVSLAPNMTELLFAIGVGDRVVGVTRYCDWPPEAQTRARVGGIIDPEFESVLGLRPDLVVTPRSGGHRGFVRRLEQAGIRTYWSEVATVADVMRTATELGRVLGATAEAEAVVARLSQRLEALSSAIDGRRRPRVLVVIGHRPLVVAAGGFVAELVAAAGGTNVAAGANIDYPTWSMEQVVRAAPDVVIDAYMGGHRSESAVIPWDRWPSIPAVRSDRVHQVRSATLLRPGPRLGEALNLLVGLLHPTAGYYP